MFILRLKSKGIKCEYFCALEPYTGRAAHCVCPFGMKWDEAKSKCIQKQDCIKYCKDSAGQDTCLTNDLLCDGYEDCSDGSDEKFLGCTQESCAIDEFACGGTNVNEFEKRMVFRLVFGGRWNKSLLQWKRRKIRIGKSKMQHKSR